MWKVGREGIFVVHFYFFGEYWGEGRESRQSEERRERVRQRGGHAPRTRWRCRLGTGLGNWPVG